MYGAKINETEARRIFGKSSDKIAMNCKQNPIAPGVIGNILAFLKNNNVIKKTASITKVCKKYIYYLKVLILCVYKLAQVEL